VKKFRVLIGVAISLGLIAWLFSSVDRQQLWEQLLHTDWKWLVVAVVLAPAGLVVRARRWHYLFPPGTNPPGLNPAVMIGYMVNNILPLRAGELVRVYVVARRWRREGAFWTAAATLIVERVLDSLCIVLILVGLVFLVEVPRVVEWAALIMFAIDVAGISMLVAIAAAPVRVRSLIVRLSRRWPGVQARLLRGFETFLHGLDGIRARGHVVPLIVWTVIVWLFPAFAAWAGLHAANLHLPWLSGWVVLAFVGLGVSIPSAPGYVGVFHAAALLAVRVFGVSEAEGLGFAIVFHASQFIPVTLVGWMFLVREHMSLGEAARATQDVSASA
jgi:uncharacterized protein (TIRG00374 family)